MSDQLGKSSLKAKRGRYKLDIKELGLQFARELADLLPQAFDKVDDNLFDLANNAHNNNEQNRYFEAMREIRLKKRRVEEALLLAISDTFIFRGDAPKQETNFPTFDTLSLVETHILEEEIAVTDMANKAKSETAEAMLTLEKRIAELYGTSTKQLNNPFAPYNVANCLAQACESLDIELTEKLLLLKQFDKCVMPELGGIYQQFDNKLLEAGILKELTSKEARAKTTNNENRQAPSSPQRKPNQPLRTKTQVQALQTLMAANHDDHPGKNTKENHQKNAATLNTNEVLHLIDELAPERDAAVNALHNTTANILSEIHDKLSSEYSNPKCDKSVKRDDLKVINLVSMLFQYILDDENLAPEMQALIAKLQLPILKVVLLDPTFFNSKNHPARQYLDRLAKAGIGWNNNGSKHGDALYEVLKLSVDRALNDFNNNIELFSHLNHELDRYLNREKKRRRLLEQRTQRAEEGRIRSRAAQNIASQTLEQIIQSSNTRLPESIETLLRDAWSRVMFMAFLKDNELHGWDQCKRMAEELVWCVNHNIGDSDRQRWVATVPRLLKEIDREISKLSASDSSKQLVDAARESLASLFRAKSLHDAEKPKKPSQNRTKRKKSQAALADQKKRPVSDSKQHYQQVSHLVPGQWVEFIDRDDKKARYKLSARISEADCFIFVDRIGLNPVEKSCRELAKDLDSGKLRLLDKGPLIDRAISQMIGSLYRN